MCGAHLTGPAPRPPAPAPGTSPQPPRTERTAPPAARQPPPARAAPQCRPLSLAPPRGRGRPALAPSPRGNLKHGAPGGGFAKIGGEGTRGPSCPIGQGSQGGPQAGGRYSGSARRPSHCCSAAGGAGGGRGAQARPAEGPGEREGGWGPQARGSGFGRPRGAGATRQPHSPCASPQASGSSSAPRKAETPSQSPTLGGGKVTWDQRIAQARRGVGTRLGRASSAAVRRRLGRGEEAAAQGCSPRLPPPPVAGDTEAPRSCGGGPRPETVQGKPTSSCLPSQPRGRRPPQYFRTVTWAQPPPSWRRVRLRGRRLETAANANSFSP